MNITSNPISTILEYLLRPTIRPYYTISSSTNNFYGSRMSDRLERYFVKDIWDIHCKYTGISSMKKCIITFAVNLKFLIQHLMILKIYKSVS